MKTLAIFACAAGLAFGQAIQFPNQPTGNPNQLSITTQYLYLNKMSFQGTWSSTAIYNSQDLVIYNSASYVSIQTGNLNNQPNVSPTFWAPLPGAAVSSVFGRSGVVVAAPGDYAASQVTNAVDKTAANTWTGGFLQSLGLVDLLLPIHSSDPGTCTAGQIEFNSASTNGKLCTATNTWTPLASGGGVSSVFGRTGAVVATSGDYTAAQVTNAVAVNIANIYTGGFLQNLSADDILLPIHSSDPATCTAGQIEFNSSSPGFKGCTAVNTWGSLGGGGGTGLAASVVTTTFSATPTFTCPSATAGTVTKFELSTALTANITSSTLTTCTPGQTIYFHFCQDTTGGRTVTMPSGFDSPTVSITASTCTDLEYSWDGTNAHLQGDAGKDTPFLLSQAPERAVPATPASGQMSCWPDSTDHTAWECMANNSATKFVMIQRGLNGLVKESSGAATSVATGHDTSTVWLCADTSVSATTYTCTTSPSFTPAAGDVVLFSAINQANSGSSTLNVNAAGAKTLKKQQNQANLVANDLAAAGAVLVEYDGTNWQVQGPTANGAGSGTVTTTGSPASPQLAKFSGSTSITTATPHDIVVPLACLDSSGSGTAQSCNTSPSFTPAAGDTIIYKTTTTNTGDVTINVNASSAVHVRKWQGSAVLASGDLVAAVYVPLYYDGTYWEIQTIGNAPAGGGGGCTQISAAGNFLIPGVEHALGHYLQSYFYSPSALTANQTLMAHVFIPCAWTPNRISFEINAAGAAGCKMEVGIYNDALTSLVVHSGVVTDVTTVACNSAGVKTLTSGTSPAASGMGTAQTAGWYWLATTSNESTITLFMDSLGADSTNLLNATTWTVGGQPVGNIGFLTASGGSSCPTTNGALVASASGCVFTAALVYYPYILLQN